MVSQEDETPQRFRFYGHFSPTILTVNDGVSTKAYVADNSNSGGRVGMWFANPWGDYMLKANVEFALGVRPSASINQIFEPDLFDFNSQTLRKGEVILETPKWGKLSFGQGSMGSDGVTESDLSGTSLANYVGIQDTAGGFFFRTAAGTLSGVTIKNAFPTFDGGRSQRLRWDSPEIKFGVLGSLRFVGSVGKEDIDRNVTLNDALQDMGLFYRNSIGQIAIAGSAGVSLAEVIGEGATPQAAGSFSLLHQPTGINGTVAAGSRDGAGHYVYLKLGVRRNFFGIGNSAFAIDFYESHDTVEAGSRAESIGLGLVQTVDRLNTDFFVGLRRHSYWGTGAVAFRDIDTFMFGVRWQFRRLERHRSLFEGLWES
ncbi:hypothetical protein [uncultured Shimia sp.]|uniref:hypothetical protein n=1 Tax=uncultured Shimia sp. TaxID=573152 RepID=UPI0026145F3A|nr:hypothetical protein [uncultured Shimia sp.]